MTNWRDGSVNFEQQGVEFPDFWSVNAANIVTTKYFRGAVGTPQREWSLKQLVDRVVGTYVRPGREHGYFATDEDAEIFDARAHLRADPPDLQLQLAGLVQRRDHVAAAGVGLPALRRAGQHPSRTGPDRRSWSTDDAVGTKVYDAHGLTKIVATKANGVKDVLRLHTKAGYVLDVTADHLVWRASGMGTGQFVPAGTLAQGDQLEWCRRYASGENEIKPGDIAEAALAGWLQSDGFVGQYDAGTNRSLTIEAMTVTDAELAWVTEALARVFPDVHQHERKVETQSTELDCRRTRLYGESLRDYVLLMGSTHPGLGHGGA